MNNREKVLYLISRYMPYDASRLDKANFIRRQRLRFKQIIIPTYREDIINKVGIFSNHVISMGGNWFKDNTQDKAYHVVKEGNTFRVDKSRKCMLKDMHKAADGHKNPSKVKPYESTHTIIQCIDCGIDREIKNCDKFQVKRCKECQLSEKKRRRVREIQAERKAKRDLRERMELDKEMEAL